MFGSALKPVDKDDLAGVVHLVASWALGDDVAQLWHRQIGAVLLEQLMGVVLAHPLALFTFDAD
jgi:hypothetical protein